MDYLYLAVNMVLRKKCMVCSRDFKPNYPYLTFTNKKKRLYPMQTTYTISIYAFNLCDILYFILLLNKITMHNISNGVLFDNKITFHFGLTKC